MESESCAGVRCCSKREIRCSITVHRVQRPRLQERRRPRPPLHNQLRSMSMASFTTLVQAGASARKHLTRFTCARPTTWATDALVFEDGSAHFTALFTRKASWLITGKKASKGNLRKQGNQYGAVKIDAGNWNPAGWNIRIGWTRAPPPACN